MDATSDDGCTKCAAESGSRALTELAADAKKAKKEGRFTKEDKKAMKAEMKPMMKDLKLDAKRRWKGMSSE